MSTGVDLIAQERQRQIAVKGWTLEHDDDHIDGMLRVAAAHLLEEPDQRHDPAGLEILSTLYPESWIKTLCEKHAAKPDSGEFSGRICRLTIAGALIAAEIDRLIRSQTNE
jgi:hypothetical protein